MIKVMTGIRRCGKSSLMKLMAEHLKETGVQDEQIIEMNFESMRFPDMDARGFYEYVKERILPDKRMYLFFDEVQRVKGWENAVNSFRVDFDCDIYITGSNAYLLSSELSTYLSGRYVEIKVLPLSFREFLDFHGYVVTERKSPAGGMRKRITDYHLLYRGPDGSLYLLRDQAIRHQGKRIPAYPWKILYCRYWAAELSAWLPRRGYRPYSGKHDLFRAAAPPL